MNIHVQSGYQRGVQDTYYPPFSQHKETGYINRREGRVFGRSGWTLHIGGSIPYIRYDKFVAGSGMLVEGVKDCRSSQQSQGVAATNPAAQYPTEIRDFTVCAPLARVI